MNKKLTDADYCRAAKRLNCPVASVKTVREVESAGEAFYPDGFPTILFERHKFYKHANRRMRDEWFRDYPELCNPTRTPRGGYGSKTTQRVKFNRAFALDPHAALMACSWGMFQELGENYDDYGFASVDEFVELMKSGEAGQLEIFCRSILKRGLADEMRRHQMADWHAFARNYNGAGYREFNYHEKLAAAYKKWSREKIDCSAEVEIETYPVDTTFNRTDEAGATSGDEPAVMPAPNVPFNQTDNQTDPSERETPEDGPASVSGLETKTVNAPPKENSVQTAAGMTFLGFTVPTFLVVIVKTVQGFVEKGYVSAESLGNAVVSFIGANQKYVFLLLALVIVLLIFRKLFKQITLWIQMWIASSPDRHDVEILKT